MLVPDLYASCLLYIIVGVSHGNDGRFDDVVPTQDSQATDVLTSLTTPYMSDEGTLSE